MTYSKYIGTPYELNARDPSGSLDCYGLVMLLYKDFHNIELPDVTVPEDPKGMGEQVDSHLPQWIEQKEPEIGSVIVFSLKGYGCHVGYYIGNDRMIHTWRGTGGVTIERISFTWKHRIMGIYKWSQLNQS